MEKMTVRCMFQLEYNYQFKRLPSNEIFEGLPAYGPKIFGYFLVAVLVIKYFVVILLSCSYT